MRLSFLLLSLAAGAAAAQPSGLVTLTETDIDNKVVPVTRTTATVDINSSLSIKIDKAALRERLAKEYPDLPAREIDAVRRIQTLVTEGMSALPEMRQALADWGDPAKRATAAAAIARVADSVKPFLAQAKREIPELDADIDRRLAARIALQGAPSMADTYAIALEAAAAYVSRLAADVDRRIAERGFYVQMGAWINTGGAFRPVHLDRFDTLPEGEFNEIKRWQLAALVSPENKAKFEAAQQTANEINSGQKEVGVVLRDALPEALVAGIRGQLACVSELDDPLRELQASGKTAVSQLRTATDALQAAIREYVDYLRSLQSRYGAFRASALNDLPTLYGAVGTDIAELERRTKALADQANKLIAQFRGTAAGLAGAEKDAVGKVEAKAKECEAGFSQQAKTLKGMISVLVNGREIGTGSLTYSDKVLKHDISRLPESTELDLRRTGQREPGDFVVIRFASADKDGDVRLKEERRLKMYKILTHVDVAVSLIFADPRKQTDLKARFQAAPSYSVLLKWGNRDSNFWNEFFDPGIGLNLAALDFNGDQSLELGLGLTVSMFKDYLQLGYGYNLNANSAYWFIGLKFPLPGQPGQPSGAK